MPKAPQLSIRIDLPGGHRIGPGKVALLQAISDTLTLKSAAESLGMSYPKALKLVEQLNQCFAVPLIRLHHGGASRGGAELTRSGRAVLENYQAICSQADQNTDALLRNLTHLN
tara:strand:+ start:10600 stop:10941 length:342 start_codon:yes stop_codon:yes gene_type:complete